MANAPVWSPSGSTQWVRRRLGVWIIVACLQWFGIRRNWLAALNDGSVLKLEQRDIVNDTGPIDQPEEVAYPFHGIKHPTLAYKSRYGLTPTLLATPAKPIKLLDRREERRRITVSISLQRELRTADRRALNRTVESCECFA